MYSFNSTEMSKMLCSFSLKKCWCISIYIESTCFFHWTTNRHIISLLERFTIPTNVESTLPPRPPPSKRNGNSFRSECNRSINHSITENEWKFDQIKCHPNYSWKCTPFNFVWLEHKSMTWTFVSHFENACSICQSPNAISSLCLFVDIIIAIGLLIHFDLFDFLSIVFHFNFSAFNYIWGDEFSFFCFIFVFFFVYLSFHIQFSIYVMVTILNWHMRTPS